MTRKEIWESYGIYRIWRPGIDDAELSEEQEKSERRFAEAMAENYKHWNDLEDSDEID